MSSVSPRVPKAVHPSQASTSSSSRLTGGLGWSGRLAVLGLLSLVPVGGSLLGQNVAEARSSVPEPMLTSGLGEAGQWNPFVTALSLPDPGAGLGPAGLSLLDPDPAASGLPLGLSLGSTQPASGGSFLGSQQSVSGGSFPGLDLSSPVLPAHPDQPGQSWAAQSGSKWPFAVDTPFLSSPNGGSGLLPGPGLFPSVPGKAFQSSVAGAGWFDDLLAVGPPASLTSVSPVPSWAEPGTGIEQPSGGLPPIEPPAVAGGVIRTEPSGGLLSGFSRTLDSVRSWFGGPQPLPFTSSGADRVQEVGPMLRGLSDRLLDTYDPQLGLAQRGVRLPEMFVAIGDRSRLSPDAADRAGVPEVKSLTELLAQPRIDDVLAGLPAPGDSSDAEFAGRLMARADLWPEDARPYLAGGRVGQLQLAPLEREGADAVAARGRYLAGYARILADRRDTAMRELAVLDDFGQLERAHRLPAGIMSAIYAAETRSGRQVHLSSAGAKGHFQVMDGTQGQYGVDGDGDGRVVVGNLRDDAATAANYAGYLAREVEGALGRLPEPRRQALAGRGVVPAVRPDDPDRFDDSDYRRWLSANIAEAYNSGPGSDLRYGGVEGRVPFRETRAYVDHKVVPVVEFHNELRNLRRQGLADFASNPQLSHPSSPR